MSALLLALLLLSATCGPTPTVGGGEEVFSSRPWYQERSEREESFCGRLEAREPPHGPGARTARSAALVLSDGSELTLYTAGIEEALAPWLGRRVLVEGKRIDLAGEGFDEELWIARIRGVSDCPGRSEESLTHSPEPRHLAIREDP